MLKNRIIKLIEKNKELITYIIFGFLSTLVNWLVYSVLVELKAFSMTASNAMAWVAAVLFAFVTNKIFVFRSKSKNTALILREVITFFCSRFASGLIEIFLPTFLFSIGLNQSIFGIMGFASKIAVSVIVVILNYITSKFLVFKSKEKGNSYD